MALDSQDAFLNVELVCSRNAVLKCQLSISKFYLAHIYVEQYSRMGKAFYVNHLYVDFITW